jgi:hypothetical protein
MYSAQGMGAALSRRRRRGMGDSQTLSFPFVVPCTVGEIDPATGDTIAGCPSYAPAPTPGVLSQSMTVSASAYPSWMYWAAGGVVGLLLLKSMK